MLRSISSRVRASRWLMAGAVIVGLVVLFSIFLGGVSLFQWTESTAFCSSCHIMAPEVTAYHGSPHSKIDCGTCHVGPGVIPAVQAKLAAIRYVYSYPLKLYQRPIPSPITSLRPVEVVCEQCHWPQKFYDDRLAVISNYASDDKNSLTKIALSLHTGGAQGTGAQTRGIHWHIANPVYYIATDDKRQNIPWVQAEFNGKTTTYEASDAKLTPQQIASAEKRKMDCVDCHNRATHVFQRPADAIDNAMAAGTIAADLPSIKQQGVAVLEKKYNSDDEALKAIAGVEDFYKTKYADVYAQRQADVKAAVSGLQQIYKSDQFPFMNVDWQSHPNNIGHLDFAGCFRCHDGNHLSSDNQAIRLECNICHSIPQVAGPGKSLPALPVSTGTEPDSHRSTTWLSEHRVNFDATCAGCHTTENPGGSDNSSFCSNGACHGTVWKFAKPVLAAPEVRAAGAAPAGQPPAIPHPIGARTDCKLCHALDKLRPFPSNHTSYTIDMCTSCHKPSVTESAQATPAATETPAATPAPTTAAAATVAPTTAAATTAPAAGAAPAIPHPVAGRETLCLTCHGPTGTNPVPADHSGRTVDTCLGCHQASSQVATPAAGATASATSAPAAVSTGAPTTAPAAAPAGAAPAIPTDHAGRDNCLLCHNPTGALAPAPAAPQDHIGRTVDTCKACHQPAS